MQPHQSNVLAACDVCHVYHPQAWRVLTVVPCCFVAARPACARAGWWAAVCHRTPLPTACAHDRLSVTFVLLSHGMRRPPGGCPRPRCRCCGSWRRCSGCSNWTWGGWRRGCWRTASWTVSSRGHGRLPVAGGSVRRVAGSCTVGTTASGLKGRGERGVGRRCWRTACPWL